MAKAKNKLPPMQALFVKEYLIDLNATQAATRAGYSAKTARIKGSQLLSKINIQEAVQEGIKKRDGRIEVTQDYVIGTIVDTAERCRQAKPVIGRDGKPVFIETPDGDVVPAYVFESKSVLKACELLGKHKGMFRDLPDADDAPMPTTVIINTVDGRKTPE